MSLFPETWRIISRWLVDTIGWLGRSWHGLTEPFAHLGEHWVVDWTVKTACAATPATALKLFGINPCQPLGAVESAGFWRLLVFTAPLTVAIALIRLSFARNWFHDAPLSRLPFMTFALLGSAYISHLSGLGRPFDITDVVLSSAWPSPNPTVSMIFEWLRIPYFSLIAYYHMYCAAAFIPSVLFGISIGGIKREASEGH